MKIRSKIQLIFGLTIFATICLIGVVATVGNYNTTMGQVATMIQTSAELAADDLSNEMKQFTRMVTQVGKETIFSGDATVEEKKAYIDQCVSNFGFSSGNILDSTGISLVDGTDFSDRSYVQTALSGIVNISDISVSKLTGKYGLSIASPTFDETNKVNGVVYFRLDNDFMTELVQEISISDSSVAYIVDAEGGVIAHVDSSEVGETNLEESAGAYAETILKSKAGNATFDAGSERMFSGYAVIDNTDDWHLIIEANQKDFLGEMQSMIILIIVIGAAALVIALVISAILAGYISQSVSKVEKILLAISKGNLNVEMQETKRKDEIGVLINATASLIGTLQGIVGQSNRILKNISEYRLLDEQVDSYPGEFNTLANSVNMIQQMLLELIRDVQQTSMVVANGSSELSDAANILSQGTITQANAIEQLQQDVETITRGITTNSENGGIINQKLTHLDMEIHSSNEQMAELLKAVEEVDEMSMDIKKIVSAIDGIAFQTNILALNASVEAARAGENGKGFAVVAQEVRGLAEKCADASGRTAELIEKCIASISNAKENADHTYDSLSTIVGNSTQIAEAFSEIANSTNEQAEHARAIKDEVNSISNVVQSNTSTAQQTAASTEKLSGQADNLKGMVGRFQFSDQMNPGLPYQMMDELPEVGRNGRY